MTWEWEGNWSGGGSILWIDFPYDRKFIIKKDERTWATGKIEKRQKFNDFTIELDVFDCSSHIYRSDISEYFSFNEKQNELAVKVFF